MVRALEAGGLGLDESVALWERGEALARRCEQQLAGARERVQQVLDHPRPTRRQSTALSAGQQLAGHRGGGQRADLVLGAAAGDQHADRRRHPAGTSAVQIGSPRSRL